MATVNLGTRNRNIRLLDTCKELDQRFPNFCWSRTTCGPCIFTAYHFENTLFQENSIYPIWLDKKFGKPALTQMPHEEQDCDKL